MERELRVFAATNVNCEFSEVITHLENFQDRAGLFRWEKHGSKLINVLSVHWMPVRKQQSSKHQPDWLPLATFPFENDNVWFVVRSWRCNCTRKICVEPMTLPLICNISFRQRQSKWFIVRTGKLYQKYLRLWMGRMSPLECISTPCPCYAHEMALLAIAITTNSIIHSG